MNGIRVTAHNPALRRNVICYDPVAAFLHQLCLRIGDHIVGFRGKADNKVRARGFAMRDAGEDIGVLR